MIGVNVEFSVLNGHLKQVLVPFISNEQFMLNTVNTHRVQRFQFIKKMDGVYLGVSRCTHCTFLFNHVHWKFLPFVSSSNGFQFFFFYRTQKNYLKYSHFMHTHKKKSLN
jgi:hypothetical protein